jgi:drug/metabolite transporter (DMT)-like permease
MKNHRAGIRRLLALVFAVAGAVIMAVDSLQHISRGFLGLSALLILGAAAAGALLGLVVGYLAGPLIDRFAGGTVKKGRDR